MIVGSGIFSFMQYNIALIGICHFYAFIKTIVLFPLDTFL